MNKVTLSPNAYFQFSQKRRGSLLFSTHDDYLHFLYLYCRHIQPIARTFAYCLLPDSFYVLLQTRDEVSLQRHAERVGESVDELVRDFSGYLECKASTFITRYHNTMSVPLPEPEKSWHCEYLPTESEVAHRLELLHLYPLYHEAVEENRAWPYTSLHSLQSSRHTFLERDTVYAWFGGREGFMRESREVYLEMS